jgi:hypothetical protein
MKYKTGKLPARNSKHIKLFAHYLSSLPFIPDTQNWGAGVVFQMFGNDQAGDCTCAGPCNALLEWNCDALHLATLSEQDAINLYSEITGYDPATGANDDGANIEDVLQYWQDNGINKHYIYSFLRIGIDNLEHLKQAIYLFGAIIVGVGVDDTDESNFTTTHSWDTNYHVDGNHCIILVGYDQNGFWAVTWGGLVYITFNWWKHRGDEAFVCVTQDWIQSNGSAPNGFNIQQLQQDDDQVV